MEGSKRKHNSKKHPTKHSTAKRTALIDNPLFHPTEDAEPREAQAQEAVAMAETRTARAAIHSTMQKIQDSTRSLMSAEKEKVNVFEIISDLEKQLDAAFRLKDSQEGEILRLKDKLAKVEEEAAESSAKLKETKGLLVSQDELNAELEFMENERLEIVEKMKAMEKDAQTKASLIKDLENKLGRHDQELAGRDVRMEQIELELTSANKAMQSLHQQISLLEEERDSLDAKLKTTETELKSAMVERDKSREELERAKESLDEIRLMLADTRARARSHYYKQK